VPQTSSLPSNGLETSKIGTAHQALRIPELSPEEAEFLSYLFVRNVFDGMRSHFAENDF